MNLAYVPDEAIERMSEISHSAFKMFVYFCKRRNKNTGLCFPSLKTIAADCGMNYSYASGIRQELVKTGWIELIEDRVIKPLLGFGFSKDSLENPKIVEFGKTKDSLEKPNSSLEKPNSSLEKPNSIYKEVLNHYIQPTQLTNTNTEQTETVASGLCETGFSQIGSFDSTEPEIQKTRKRKPTEPLTKLPLDFSITKEMRLWANEKVSTVAIDGELEEFVNFWCFIATKNNQRTAKGWVATWQTRMRNIHKRNLENGVKTNGTNQSNGNKYPRKQTNAEILAESADFYANYPN